MSPGFYNGYFETHAPDDRHRITRLDPCGWWNVFVDGCLVAGFLTRDVARAVVRVAKGDNYAVTFKEAQS